MPATDENKGTRYYLSEIFSLKGLKNLLRPSGLRGLRRLLTIGALVAVAVPAQLLIAGPLFKNSDAVRMWMLRSLHRIMGIHVTFNGAVIERGRTMLYFGNHPSWVDAMALGGVLPGTVVTTKRTERFPIFRNLAHSWKLILIDQGGGMASLPGIHEQLVKSFNEGRSLTVMPEGVSSGTNAMGPFKTGIVSVLFNNMSAVKLEKDILAQPFAIRVTHVDGRKLEDPAEIQNFFNSYARWDPGKMWTLVQKKRIDVEITALPVMNPKDYSGYKEFTKAGRDALLQYVPSL